MRRKIACIAAVLSVAAGTAAYNAAAQVNVYDELKSARSKSGNYQGMEARTINDPTIKGYGSGSSENTQPEETQTEKEEQK